MTHGLRAASSIREEGKGVGSPSEGAGISARVSCCKCSADPVSGARMPPLVTIDIGEAAAGALVSKGEHDGQTCVITGPCVHTYTEVTAAISGVTPHEIEVRPVPPQALGGAVQAKGGSDLEAPHLVGMLELCAQGVSGEVFDDGDHLTDRAARSVEHYLADRAAVFASVPA